MQPGIIITALPNNNFKNELSTGDSDSGLFMYDTVKEKWVLIGVVSMGGGGYTEYSLVSKTDLDAYKKTYEKYINKAIIGSADLDPLKDNIITQPSKITIYNELELGSGGIVFQKGQHVISGHGSLTGLAGFDIEQDASVELNIPIQSTLQK
ncbi:S6 family peptidase [Campylobacter suis]|uniref:Serine protease EspC n=1 Tax=Campylobacter suis TaxID=2790657 RepID=A0ABM8Q8N5_9BACT|nr:S6 family peptidase [Campylobacter suis]CAD7289342.1 Serine protease EspC [Campylobacter suis]